MRSILNNIPIALILSRLVIGIVIIVISMLNVDHYSAIAIVLLTVGLLSDIFDGIISRRLNVSTPFLRRLDSSVDQIFYIMFAVATYIQCDRFFIDYAWELTLLLSVEGMTYLVSFIKFRKEVATHTIGAKIWTLLLFATLIQIILECQSHVLFSIFFWVGIITRLEIIGIVFTLKEWTNDVPTLYHSIQLRKGKAIKRHKLFNG